MKLLLVASAPSQDGRSATFDSLEQKQCPSCHLRGQVLRRASGEVHLHVQERSKHRDRTQVRGLVCGGNPQDYCIGFVKGTQTECERAKTKYHDDAVWKLAKASLDTYTATAYISTPIQFRVDLAKSTMTILDAQDGIGKRLRGSIPKNPVPPRSVADVARITTNRRLT